MVYKIKKVAVVSDKVLVYLNGFKYYNGDYDGIFEMSQSGISAAIGVDVKNVIRAIRPLIASGLVEEHSTHIPGLRQKRCTYYITITGRQKASSILKMILETEIHIIGHGNDDVLINLGEAMSGVLSNLTLTDVLRELGAGKTLDYGKVMKEMKRLEKTAPRQPTESQKSRQFFGRAHEKEIIREWLKSEKRNTLVILGVPGIGKSRLVTSMMDEFSESNDVFFFNITQWCALRPLVQTIADALERHGIDELKRYITEHENIEMFDLEMLLSRLVKDKKLIFIFDNIHNLTVELIPLFSMMTALSRAQNGLKIIALGRDTAQFYDRSDLLEHGTVIEIRLGELNDAESDALARSFTIPEARAKEILAIAGNHPLFIELLAQGCRPDGKITLERYITEVFMASLDSEESELLRYLSVFRHPVERPGLANYQPAILSLLNKSILKLSEDNYVILHDVIKDVLCRQLSQRELEKYHSNAARYYMESGKAASQIEAANHILQSGRADEAARFMVARMDELLKTGRMESIARIITLILSRNEGIDDVSKAIFLHAQGIALAYIGETDSALDNFNRSAEIAAATGSELYLARSKLGIAKIMLKRNIYDKSETLLRDVLEWTRKNAEPVMEAEANYQLGTIYERQCVSGKAIMHFRNAWGISLGLNDCIQLAQALYGIGRIHHAESKLEDALKSKNEALEIASRCKNEYLAAKILTSIAWTLNDMGRLNDAIDANEKAIALARKIGAVRVLAYTLSNAGAAFIDKPDLIRASDCLAESFTIFEKIGERRMIATVKLNMATVLLLRGKKKEGRELFDEVIKRLETINDLSDLMISYFKFGQVLKKVGQNSDARKILKKALRISRELMDGEASEQIAAEMQGL